jgi:hypothetical protein
VGNVYTPVSNRANTSPIFRYLDTAGDGSGTKEVLGDYSVTPDDIYIEPPDTWNYYISRMIVTVVDGTLNNADLYGGLGGALSNGISVLKTSGATTLSDYTDGLPVKTNGNWATLCHDVTVHTGFANGNDYQTIRWTLARSGGIVMLRSAFSERLVVRVNDDFSGLVSHLFMVQGYQRREGQD